MINPDCNMQIKLYQTEVVLKNLLLQESQRQSGTPVLGEESLP